MDKEKLTKFEENRGRILSLALHVESNLEFFISNYFCKPQNDKTHFFGDIFLLDPELNIGFEQKIRLFIKICNREEFNNDEVSKIIKSIRFVQKIRNKVAHWQSLIDEKIGIHLRKRTSFTYAEDVLILDSSTMEKFEEATRIATSGIMELYLRYQKEGTIDERLLKGTGIGDKNKIT